MLYPRDCLAKRENKHKLKPSAKIVDLADGVELTQFVHSDYEKSK